MEQAERAKADVAKYHKESNKPAERKAIQSQIDNLGWFIGLAPDDPRALDAMESHGMLLADNFRDSASTFAAAYTRLENVVSKDPERTTARKKLIDLWLLARRYSDARTHIEYLLDRDRNDPHMLALLGQCYVATGEDQKAKAALLEAIKISSKISSREVDAYFQLALLLQKNPKLCDRVEKGVDEDEEAAEKRKASENTPEAVMARMIENYRADAKSASLHVQVSFGIETLSRGLERGAFSRQAILGISPR